MIAGVMIAIVIIVIIIFTIIIIIIIVIIIIPVCPQGCPPPQRRLPRPRVAASWGDVEKAKVVSHIITGSLTCHSSLLTCTQYHFVLWCTKTKTKTIVLNIYIKFVI